MEKTISIEEARKKLGRLVDDARQKGDLFIISKKGKPAAALVPIRVMELYKESKQVFLEIIEAVHERNRNKSSDEIERLVDEAVQQTRSKTYI